MYFLKDVMLLFTLKRLQYNVNISFICTGKQKNSYDLLYYNYFFIAVVWSKIRNYLQGMPVKLLEGHYNEGKASFCDCQNKLI